MQVIVTDPQIKQAIELVSTRAGDEKRVLSPDPEHEFYWHHLIRVYHYLKNNGEEDQDTLLAAILHDAIEDGHTTAAEITELFNARVAEIVQLLSEDEHTDHNFSGSRDYYFERMASYPNADIRNAAMKIKVTDRYDNLLGISFTDLEKKKEQFTTENEKYLNGFAAEVGLARLLEEGMAVLNGENPAPDLKLELVFG